MKILMLNHNVAWSGGTFYRAYPFARALTQRGHQVTLLTIAPRRRCGFETEERHGVEIVHTPDLFWGRGRTGWDPWDTWQRLRFVHGRQWEIVHAWDSRPAVILPALYARRQSVPTQGKLVIDWCDWWGRGGIQAERHDRFLKACYGPIETFFEEAFRCRADGTTVISKVLARRATGLGVPADTMLLLPQGCDPEMPVATDRLAARARLGLPATSPLLVTLGKLLPSEGTLLFDTMRLLFGRRPDCRLIMIGHHQTQIPSTLRMDGRLREAGFVPDSTLRDFVSACDAVVMPLADSIASQARWPSKVNMFLTAGRAPVLTRIGDLAGLLEREGAALVAASDPQDLADKLVTVLDDGALRERVEGRARHVAEDILAWPRLAAQLESFYVRIRTAVGGGHIGAARSRRAEAV